jgi:hypothetical protein
MFDCLLYEVVVGGRNRVVNVPRELFPLAMHVPERLVSVATCDPSPGDPDMG